MNVSNKALGIAPSVTLEIDAKAKKMKADGLDVVGFGAGEPDFNTPRHVIEAAVKAMDEGKTRYTPASGTIELRRAICDKLLRDNGLSYTPDQIVVSNGAKHSLFNAFQAILNPGDEVLLPAPYWVSYYEQIKMADGVPVPVMSTQEEGFVVSFEALDAAVTPKTKALLLNSPSNPTGMVYSKEQLQAVANIALKHDLYIISDEIYESLVYDGTRHISIASLSPEIQERTILVNGLSKAYAMTGWRIGYTASNTTLAKVMGNYQSHSTSNPNSIAQAAGIAALTGNKDELNEMVRQFSERREYMVNRVNAIPGFKALMPKGAFYVFVNISGVFGKHTPAGAEINSALDFSKYLLEDKLCAVVPGEAFGDARYMRLAYATDMNSIKKGLDRIEEFVRELK